MPELASKFFRGAADIPANRAADLVTFGDGGAINDTLTPLGWEGQVVGAVVLNISVDGSTVTSGQFLMRGELAKEIIKVKVDKLWEKSGKDVVLGFTMPRAEEFVFPSGQMSSEYMASTNVKFAFTRGEMVIPETSWAEEKLGNFSLRIICHLGKTSNGTSGPHLKYTVLMFPYSPAELEELSDMTQSTSWPGIRVLEGQCGFFPNAPEGQWGAPFFPLLGIRDKATNTGQWPSGEWLRYTLAEVMRSAATPTVCVSLAGLKKQVKAMLKDRSLAEEREPIITWPETARPEGFEGKKLLLNLYVSRCSIKGLYRVILDDESIYIRIHVITTLTGCS